MLIVSNCLMDSCVAASKVRRESTLSSKNSMRNGCSLAKE